MRNSANSCSKKRRSSAGLRFRRAARAHSGFHASRRASARHEVWNASHAVSRSSCPQPGSSAKLLALNKALRVLTSVPSAASARGAAASSVGAARVRAGVPDAVAGATIGAGAAAGAAGAPVPVGAEAQAHSHSDRLASDIPRPFRRPGSTPAALRRRRGGAGNVMAWSGISWIERRPKSAPHQLTFVSTGWRTGPATRPVLPKSCLARPVARYSRCSSPDRACGEDACA